MGILWFGFIWLVKNFFVVKGIEYFYEFDNEKIIWMGLLGKWKLFCFLYVVFG